MPVKGGFFSHSIKLLIDFKSPIRNLKGLSTQDTRTVPSNCQWLNWNNFPIGEVESTYIGAIFFAILHPSRLRHDALIEAVNTDYSTIPTAPSPSYPPSAVSAP